MLKKEANIIAIMLLMIGLLCYFVHADAVTNASSWSITNIYMQNPGGNLNAYWPGNNDKKTVELLCFEDDVLTDCDPLQEYVLTAYQDAACTKQIGSLADNHNSIISSNVTEDVNGMLAESVVVFDDLNPSRDVRYVQGSVSINELTIKTQCQKIPTHNFIHKGYSSGCAIGMDNIVTGCPCYFNGNNSCASGTRCIANDIGRVVSSLHPVGTCK